MWIRGVVGLSAALLGLASCRVIPHAADPRARVVRVQAGLVNAARVRVEVLRVNGARLPERAWARALATLGASVGGPVEVVELEPLTLAADGQGRLPEPFQWPVCTPAELASGAVVERELAAGAWLELRRGEIPIALVALDRDGTRAQLPVVAPNVLLVAILDLDHEPRALHGWCTPLHSTADREAALEPSGSLIVIQCALIEERSSWLVSHEKLAEHTLVHEFGHALGLPADPARAWIGPHYGTHCTHPECALYPAFDWRSVCSGLLNGWPLQYCEACRAELAAVLAADSGG